MRPVESNETNCLGSPTHARVNINLGHCKNQLGTPGLKYGQHQIPGTVRTLSPSVLFRICECVLIRRRAHIGAHDHEHAQVCCIGRAAADFGRGLAKSTLRSGRRHWPMHSGRHCHSFRSAVRPPQGGLCRFPVWGMNFGLGFATNHYRGFASSPSGLESRRLRSFKQAAFLLLPPVNFPVS